MMSRGRRHKYEVTPKAAITMLVLCMCGVVLFAIGAYHTVWPHEDLLWFVVGVCGGGMCVGAAIGLPFGAEWLFLGGVVGAALCFSWPLYLFITF